MRRATACSIWLGVFVEITEDNFIGDIPADVRELASCPEALAPLAFLGSTAYRRAILLNPNDRLNWVEIAFKDDVKRN